jgi:NAD(P)H-flavin reductase
MNASNGLLWLEIGLPPSWTVQPGQYVQLWMPRVGIRAGLQLRLFYVAVCKKDGAHKIARLVIARLVARSRSGIIRKLYDRNLASSRGHRIPVTVLGPYGRPDNLLLFGTVVLVVEDIGFFRALSYIEILVVASLQRKV